MGRWRRQMKFVTLRFTTQPWRWSSLLIASLGLMSCGAPARTGATSSLERRSQPVATGQSSSQSTAAIAFVQTLVTRAPATNVALIDRAFAADADQAGVPDWQDPQTLWTLLTSIPTDCKPVWNTANGYTDVAIPPPMVDDSEAQAARIERVIDKLRESVEVSVVCPIMNRWTECEEAAEPGEEICEDLEEAVDVVVFAIAVHRADDGTWQVRAWRSLKPRVVKKHKLAIRL